MNEEFIIVSTIVSITGEEKKGCHIKRNPRRELIDPPNTIFFKSQHPIRNLQQRFWPFGSENGQPPPRGNSGHIHH